MSILWNSAADLSAFQSVVYQKSGATSQKISPLKITPAMQKYIKIALPRSLKGLSNQQVFALRDIENSVSIFNKDDYRKLKSKLKTANNKQGKPQITKFLLADTVLCDVTTSRTLYLPENLERYFGPTGTIKVTEQEGKISIRKN